MGKRQSQHHGRSAGDDREPVGGEVAADAGAGVDPLEAVEAAREISRVLDREEGYDRPLPKSERKRDSGLGTGD